MSKIKFHDTVEVLPGCVFSSLVYSKGIVIQTFSSKMAVVRFQQNKHWTDPKDLSTIFLCSDWLIPFDKLKVLDSPHDTRLGDLEEEILGLEADLVTARCCIAISEELREQQQNLIEKLVQEIDILKAELYHLKSNGN